LATLQAKALFLDAAELSEGLLELTGEAPQFVEGKLKERMGVCDWIALQTSLSIAKIELL
jgi:hypothetical protein